MNIILGLTFIISSLWFYKKILDTCTGAKGWIETPCLIEDGTVILAKSFKLGKKIYRPHFVYSYRVDGIKYKSENVNLAKFLNYSYEEAQSIIDEKPIGTKSVCYVKPHKPKESVIEHIIPFNKFLLPLGCLLPVLFFVGFIIIIFSLK